MDTFYFMMQQAFDVMIMDTTVGDYEGDYRMAEHNSIPMIRMMEKSFRTVGIATEKTKIVLDHLAGTLHKPYEVLCETVKPDGYIVAFDGMQMTI